MSSSEYTVPTGLSGHGGFGFYKYADPTELKTDRPLITVTSVVPAETDREILTVEGIATDDHGIAEVKVRVKNSSTKGIMLVAPITQKQKQFEAEVRLVLGHNDIIIEAMTTTGQIGRQTFTVVRTLSPVGEATPVSSLTSEIPAELLKRPGNVYAVIIGIGAYKDTLLNLQFTVNDAQGMYDVLTDPNYGRVPKDHIKLLLDENATDRTIKGAIGKWLSQQAREDDTVIIYYSGHGAPEGQAMYWLTHNADINDLYTTALNNDEIADMLSRIRAKRVITFLDSCYSAATVRRKDRTRAVVTEIPWEKFSGEGRVTISASDGKQLSLELDKYKHGVFTYYLLEGLKGQADTNQDGVIDVDEIWNYVKRQVTETAAKAGNTQTPVFQGSVTAGIPLTFNMAMLQDKQHLKRQQQEAVQKLYEQGLINAESFECALNILDSDTPNRYLDDLLSGKITPETFSRFFQCNSQR
ncbi:caspase family protein [Desulfococcaceae bacterium HSG9]|nr:caspase family protein [Desulfococcaceae bacterium HSG9]